MIWRPWAAHSVVSGGISINHRDIRQFKDRQCPGIVDREEVGLFVLALLVSCP